MQSIAPSPRPHRPRRTGRAAPQPSSPRASGSRGALGSARGDPAASPAGASLPGGLGRSRSWSPPRASEGSVSEKKTGSPQKTQKPPNRGSFYIALGFLRGRGEGVRDKSSSFLGWFFFLFFFFFYFLFVCIFPPSPSPPPGRSALSTYQTLKESVRSRCKIRFKFKETFGSPGGQAV